MNGGDPNLPHPGGVNNFFSHPPGVQPGGPGGQMPGMGQGQSQQGSQGQQQRPGMPGTNNFMAPTPFPPNTNAPAAGGSSGGNASGTPGPPGVGPPSTNSPHPPPPSSSSEMNSGNLSGVSSPLPSVDSKKDVIPNKMLSPSSSGYQGSTATTADPSLQSTGLPSLSSSVNIKEEPMSISTSAVSGSHVTDSPRPPPSAEMKPISSIPSVRSLPSVESKKDIFQSKVPTPPSSGFQESSTAPPSAQSVEPMLQGGSVPSVPEQKPASVSSNQKIKPEPSLRKGESGHALSYRPTFQCPIGHHDLLFSFQFSQVRIWCQP